MPSLAKDNPLKPAADKVLRIRSTLMTLFKSVIGKLRTMLKSFLQFVKKVRSAIKEIAAKVGKSVVNMLVAASDKVTALLATLERMFTNAIKFADKILKTILNAADPAKILKAVKALVARYVSIVREIFSRLQDILAVLDPVGAALKAIDTFRLMLQLVISWITEVSGASSAVNKARSLVKKAVKTLKAELKTVTELVKDTAALKPA